MIVFVEMAGICSMAVRGKEREGVCMRLEGVMMMMVVLEGMVMLEGNLGMLPMRAVRMPWLINPLMIRLTNPSINLLANPIIKQPHKP